MKKSTKLLLSIGGTLLSYVALRGYAEKTLRDNTKFLEARCRVNQLKYDLLCGLLPNAGADIQRVETEWGPVRVLTYGFDERDTTPLLINIHGGGYIEMRAKVDATLCAYMAKTCRARVVNIDYPLAPKTKYPTQLEICYAVVKHYIQNAQALHIDPARVGIMGHSAGGNMAAALSLLSIARQEFTFKLQILNYPWLDLSADYFTRPSPAGSVPRFYFHASTVGYLGENAGELVKTPLVSPVYASPEQLMPLPPTLVLLCGRDSLYDEGLRYAEMMRNAGVAVTVREYPAMPHGFTGVPFLKESREAMELMSGFAITNL
jgi:acetyl esterase